VLHSSTGLVRNLSERQVHEFQLGQPALPFGMGERGEKVVLFEVRRGHVGLRWVGRLRLASLSNLAGPARFVCALVDIDGRPRLQG